MVLMNIKPKTILIFGIWLIAVSFFGIDDDWKIALYGLTGVIFILIYLIRFVKDAILKIASRTEADSFSENSHHNDSINSQEPPVQKLN